MRYFQKSFAWIQVIILLSLSSQCTKSMEPHPSAGFDIQQYYSPDSYQSLYVQKDETDFVLISNGKRTTGHLTKVEHKKLFSLLKKENRKEYYDNSILGSDTLSYPYLSIRKRSESTSFTNSGFFVILPLNSKEKIPMQLINLVNKLLDKYNR